MGRAKERRLQKNGKPHPSKFSTGHSHAGFRAGAPPGTSGPVGPEGPATMAEADHFDILVCGTGLTECITAA